MTQHAHVTPDSFSRFRAAYTEHRVSEGRGAGGRDELLSLPYPTSGAHVRSWGVRARTYEMFLRRTVARAATAAGERPLDVLDMGAGNCWLSYRLAQLGHEVVALDVRDDAEDGLGCGTACEERLGRRLLRIAGSFEQLPLRQGRFDIVVFNASLHYAMSLERVLEHARTTARPGGWLAILDTPFYRHEAHGRAMVREKHETGSSVFGSRAADLLHLPFVEFLTPERLQRASAPLGLTWKRHRVRYPLWYELRPLLAWLKRRRPPSRFDLWEAQVP